MTSLRLIAMLLAATLLSSCQTAGTLVQEPFTLLNDMFTTVGRTLHTSDNDRKPGDSSIEAAEAEQAQLALQQDAPVKDAGTPAAGLKVAAR